MKQRTVAVVGVVFAVGFVLIFAAISSHSAEEMPFTEFKRIPNDKQAGYLIRNRRLAHVYVGSLRDRG
jgi:hypothetical protein